MGGTPTPPLFSRGVTLLPSMYADARYIDAVVDTLSFPCFTSVPFFPRVFRSEGGGASCNPSHLAGGSARGGTSAVQAPGVGTAAARDPDPTCRGLGSLASGAVPFNSTHSLHFPWEGPRFFCCVFEKEPISFVVWHCAQIFPRVRFVAPPPVGFGAWAVLRWSSTPRSLPLLLPPTPVPTASTGASTLLALLLPPPRRPFLKIKLAYSLLVFSSSAVLPPPLLALDAL